MAPSLQALEQLARRLASEGRWDADALRLNRLILEQEAGHYPALRRIARWHELNGDAAGQREYLERALDAAPTPADRRRVEELLAPPVAAPAKVAPRRRRAVATTTARVGARASAPAGRTAVAMPTKPPPPAGDVLLMPAERSAFHLYESYSVHIVPMSGGTTTDLAAGRAERLAFFVQGAVAAHVPRVLAVVPTVPTRTSTLPQITRAGGDSDAVAEALADWRRLGRTDDFARVFLLTPADSADTERLSAPLLRREGEPAPSGSEFVFLEDLRSAGTYGELVELTRARRGG
jgi:hypothetical protein